MGKAVQVGQAIARRSGTADADCRWSDWKAIPGLPATTPEVLGETVDGGQAFRWTARSDGSWLGVWGDSVARVRVDEQGIVAWSAPVGIAARVGPAIAHYFGADADFAGATDRLPWRSDAHLARCLEAFPGLRILRQPFGETLLCFLCSATKQIVQIKQMVALLAERHGEQIAADEPSPDSRQTGTAPLEANSAIGLSVGRGLRSATGGERSPRPTPDTGNAPRYFSLPSWEKLATIPEPRLRDCLLGFRAKYIAETAAYLAKHPGWLEHTETLPYAEAKERLCALPGVGEKIADCVLLFGAGRLEAFPVDVWILRTLAKRYELHGWKPNALSQFGRVHFGANAGLAQQFLFAWERRRGRE